MKLYELESSGTWVDHGIGFAYIQLNSTFNGPALSVISESSTDQFLLQSKIQSEDLYEKQGGKGNSITLKSIEYCSCPFLPVCLQKP